MLRHCFSLSSMSGSGRKWGRSAVFLVLLVLTALLSLFYVTNTARNYDHISSTLRPVPTKSRWCPYYPSSVEEIADIFDPKSLADLQSTVSSKMSKDVHISLLVASESVLLTLVNWMCVSRRGMGGLPKNLLVVVPPGNSSVIMRLGSKGIPVVQMEFSKECQSNMPSNMRSFMQPIAVRVLTIMLLTDPSWGYDVAVYDPDAFILHDPTDMYLSAVEGWGVDVVAQMGRFPPALSAVWGFTLCMGATFYKSTPRLKHLWSHLGEKQGESSRSTSKLQLNDQGLLNQALQEMKVEWTQVPYCEGFLGTTEAGVKAIALGPKCSVRQFPGQKADKGDSLNVIHPMLGHNTQSKMKALHKNGLWALIGDSVVLNNDFFMDSNDWLDTVCITSSL